MEKQKSPRVVTSKRQIKYRDSAWRVHEFEVWSGDLLCRVASLRMQDSVFLWIGAGEAVLSEVALGMPQSKEGSEALASALLGAETGAVALARRLAMTLGKPVYVCCGASFDRFTAPLVERGLIAEIKSRPECFT